MANLTMKMLQEQINKLENKISILEANMAPISSNTMIMAVEELRYITTG